MISCKPFPVGCAVYFGVIPSHPCLLELHLPIANPLSSSDFEIPRPKTCSASPFQKAPPRTAPSSSCPDHFPRKTAPSRLCPWKKTGLPTQPHPISHAVQLGTRAASLLPNSTSNHPEDPHSPKCCKELKLQEKLLEQKQLLTKIFFLSTRRTGFICSLSLGRELVLPTPRHSHTTRPEPQQNFLSKSSGGQRGFIETPGQGMAAIVCKARKTKCIHNPPASDAVLPLRN